MSDPIHIIGAGLAGSEAAWQIARRGLKCVLHEMRPVRPTSAHQTDRLAELVCSNSLKSETESTAPWLLKEELRRLGSLLLEAAARARVPGGQALTVDRDIFANEVTAAIAAEPLIEVRREEVTAIPPEPIVIVATGPLTSDSLAEDIARLTGSERLYFYDAISPIVDADSVDTGAAFWASRYNKSVDSTGDYLNCPLDREQYERFVDALLVAQPATAHIEEDRTPFFEACLPIEELARRGRDTLRFGPMKPVGLSDPRTGRRPYAVVQLRQESVRTHSFNLVGFQNHMKFGDQARVLRMIPGLETAEFLRFGQIHRNTYINAPALRVRDSPVAHGPARSFCRADFRRGRLRGSYRHRPDGGNARSGAGRSRNAARIAARDRTGFPVPLHRGRRSRELPAGQHHFRSAAGARRDRAPAPPPRQEGAARRGVPARPGSAGRVSSRLCVSRARASVMYKNQSITVIIPCLNEEQGIEQILRSMPAFVDEVIVVDNASTDRTSEVAARLGAKVIREDVRGYGRSYKRGFREAIGDLIVTLDGDHSYPVDALSYLIEAFLHFDVDFLNASRFPVRDARSMSFLNKIGNLVLSLAMSILFFRWVRDSQSGMWVFRRAILEHMKLESDGMSFSEEIKIEALRDSRIRFGEISIMYTSRLGETKLNLWRDGFANLAFLVKKRFWR